MVQNTEARHKHTHNRFRRQSNNLGPDYPPEVKKKMYLIHLDHLGEEAEPREEVDLKTAKLGLENTLSLLDSFYRKYETDPYEILDLLSNIGIFENLEHNSVNFELMLP